MTYDLVIQNGNVITSTSIAQADVAVLDGKIAEIAPGLSGRERISADGMLVIPGGVDPHVHIQMPVANTATSDHWETSSRAAALGGTTSVIDFVETERPDQLLLDAFHARLGLAHGKSWIDFAFHMTLSSGDAVVLGQVPGVVEAGMPSFKLYTTYDGFRLSDIDLLHAFQAIAKAGGLALVHTESDTIVSDAIRQLRTAGKLSVADFPQSRPAIAEKEAIERVLSLANFAQTPVYIVHVSTQAGAAAIARSRSGGQKAWGETCPQYLLLNDALIKTADSSGAKFICCPPLRTLVDNQALWNALKHGDLQTVGTDHCSFNVCGQKDQGQNSFLEIPPGLTGIELRLALLYTYGVKTGRMSLQQWVAACCTAPAQIFGLFPRKGDLLPGADADLVIFNPDLDISISRSLLHEEVDYTPYEGLRLAGLPRTVLLRGQVLVRDRVWVGGSIRGEYLKC